jgi:hypothetical protein
MSFSAAITGSAVGYKIIDRFPWVTVGFVVFISGIFVLIRMKNKEYRK